MGRACLLFIGRFSGDDGGSYSHSRIAGLPDKEPRRIPPTAATIKLDTIS